jgi:transcriptional regulator with XRE-family HTH domain
LRQSDVAASAGLSQQAISLIERGHLTTLSIRSLRRAFAAVDARFEGVVSWRGGQIDRLLDERHAVLVGQMAGELVRWGWEVHVETTFSEYGERGSIDVLALWRSSGIALVIEVKTELTAIDDTIRRLDIKGRLGAKLVLDRFGWRPVVVARMLVVLDRSTNRRRVAAHEGSLLRAFPDRGSRLRRWMQTPTGPISGLRFVSPTNRSSGRRVGAGPAARPRGE